MLPTYNSKFIWSIARPLIGEHSDVWMPSPPQGRGSLGGTKLIEAHALSWVQKIQVLSFKFSNTNVLGRLRTFSYIKDDITFPVVNCICLHSNMSEKPDNMEFISPSCHDISEFAFFIMISLNAVATYKELAI